MDVTHLEDPGGSVDVRLGNVRGHGRAGNAVVEDATNFRKRRAGPGPLTRRSHRVRIRPVDGSPRARRDGRHAVRVSVPPAEEEAGRRKADRRRGARDREVRRKQSREPASLVGARRRREIKRRSDRRHRGARATHLRGPKPTSQIRRPSPLLQGWVFKPPQRVQWFAMQPMLALSERRDPIADPVGRHVASLARTPGWHGPTLWWPHSLQTGVATCTPFTQPPYTVPKKCPHWLQNVAMHHATVRRPG